MARITLITSVKTTARSFYEWKKLLKEAIHYDSFIVCGTAHTDATSSQNDLNTRYLDRGSFVTTTRESTYATVEEWEKEFPINLNTPKPFWFRGTRYTRKEFTTIMVLK